MDEPRVEELLYRIETLEKENRRWKRIGIGSLCILLVLVVFGGLFSVAVAVRYVAEVRAVREAAMRERNHAEQARQAEMQQREAAEQARQAMEVEQRARQAAEKKAKDDRR